MLSTTEVLKGEGYAKRALIALMRKLALALYYVGRGESFDFRRLVPGAERFQRQRKKSRNRSLEPIA
jgi:hypothetical protein